MKLSTGQIRLVYGSVFDGNHSTTLTFTMVRNRRCNSSSRPLKKLSNAASTCSVVPAKNPRLLRRSLSLTPSPRCGAGALTNPITRSSNVQSQPSHFYCVPVNLPVEKRLVDQVLEMLVCYGIR